MLWKLLRSEVEVLGTHFRRQVAIGPYVADFVCLGEKLILEADGEAHATAANYDMKRDDYLSGKGFRVLRFSNRDVMLHRAAVLEAVRAALGRATPTPSPSPQGGGGL